MPKHRLLRMAAAASLTSSLFAALPSVSSASTTTDEQTYLVVFRDSAVPADASATLARAGGRLVYSYDAIGVAIATSKTTAFRDDVKKDSRVEDAGNTALGAVRVRDRLNGEDDGLATDAESPATDNDSLSSRQWDMRQIHAPEAHAITSGSRSVLVGDIDTGLDYRHPDLKPNIDFNNSVSCIGGTPNTSPSAWNDDNGHGTHTAGTIAAASNGIGIVGVAPNVRIAAIKAGNIDGYFYPEAVVCSFMWAGTHGVDVTNNSYFADPYYYNCPSDSAQRAILTAESRAIRFAQSQGVTVVAAAGNFSDDLANPTIDRQSPDDATPVDRPVDRSCNIVPTTLPGVIVVTADGNKLQKSFYSSYGFGIVDVTAPGGDSILQVTPVAPNGRVLSTFPPNATLIPANRCRASRTITIPTTDPQEPTATYCYLQGTSMASPHVAGEAALILSRLKDANYSRGNDASAHLRNIVDSATDHIACPTPAVLAEYAPFPQVDSPNSSTPQSCTGTLRYNSWYGHGQINVLKAVLAATGD